jgi:hypothetical protein
MKETLNLLDQIIEAQEAQDLELNRKNAKKKASLTVGDSWMTFHLGQLRE